MYKFIKKPLGFTLITACTLCSLTGCGNVSEDTINTEIAQDETSVFTMESTDAQVEETLPDATLEASSDLLTSGNFAGVDLAVTHERSDHMTQEDYMNFVGVNDNGNYEIYPVERNDFDKIPDISYNAITDSSIYVEYSEMINATTLKFKYIPEDFRYNDDRDDYASYYIVHLVGIDGYESNDVLPGAWDYERAFLESLFGDGETSSKNTYLMISSIIADTDTEHEVEGYIWYDKPDEDGRPLVSLLQETLLIEGYVEPDLNDNDSLFLNWTCQYPNLYPYDEEI